MLVGAELPAWNGEATRGDPLAEVRDGARAEGDVHERVLLEDLLPLRLRVTPAHRDHEIGLVPLASRRVAEMCGETRVRLLAHRAGVEDHHVGGVFRGRLTEAKRLEHAFDPLGIVRVHLAPERRDVIPAHGSECSPHHPTLRRRGAEL